MEFVIIRPGGLKNEPSTGAGILTEDNSVCGAIHREDLADLVISCLFSDNAENKVGPQSRRRHQSVIHMTVSCGFISVFIG